MHLYVHVPFCARRCSYCDFAIAVRRETPSAAFVDTISAEWDARRPGAPWAEDRQLDTIYFGGGTPSRLEPGAIGRLVARFAADAILVPGAEVTIEANPDDVSPRAAEAWVRAGINRVSLGVQTFSPEGLAWMHRTHSADQVPGAVSMLRAAGLRNVSLDLIYALPASVPRDWALDLDRAFALEPSHLSLYGLTVESHTPLGRWSARGEVRPAAEDRAAEEYLQAHERLVGEGFDHYEVSNAARPGCRSLHNSAYWRRAPFLGLGPSAHSGRGNWRSWNIREWVAYQRAVQAGVSSVEAEETLSPGQIRLEERYLSLRTSEGISPEAVPVRTLQRWTAEGWLEPADGRVRLTAEGWLRLDALVGTVSDF